MGFHLDVSHGRGCCAFLPSEANISWPDELLKRVTISIPVTMIPILAHPFDDIA